MAEVLEGKAAAAFSKSSRDADDKPQKEKKPKKDRRTLENLNMFLHGKLLVILVLCRRSRWRKKGKRIS